MIDIVRIFGGEIPCLSSFRFEINGLDEFNKVMDEWNDVEYLTDFFTRNESDLNSSFIGGITIEEAVKETLDDVSALETKLMNLAQSSSTNNSGSGLDAMFKDLYNGVAVELSPTKAYGVNKKRDSWLRIYAIKLGSNVYVITGGAIKLTKTMGEREHTREELLKFKRCLNYLKETGVWDEWGLKDID